MKTIVFLLIVLGVVYCEDTTGFQSEDVAAEIHDIVEIVPYDLIASVFMEYLATDIQVNKVLHYLTSDTFKTNLVWFETSNAFHEMHFRVLFPLRQCSNKGETAPQNASEQNITFDYLLPFGIDLYKCTNELNSLLDITQVRRLRKRSPGDGLFGLIKDLVELTPLNEMKLAYNSKLKTNPKFKELIDKLLTSETRTHIYNLMSTQEFEETATDLNSIGVPIADVIKYIEQLIIKFFDLDNKLSE